MRIAGIDQGTTSTRTLILDHTGSIRVAHAVAHRQIYRNEGWVEHDPEELIRNIQTCANAAGKVDAIGIDNQGESCLAWDAKTKEALSPVIVWQDIRSIAEIERLKADDKEAETLARAGPPLDPYFSAAKLGWLVENLPAVKGALSRGTLRLGTTDAFFLDRLTGRFVTDVSTASRTSLLNLGSLQWDENLCEIFGVPIDCLPEIVPTTGDFGTLMTEHGAVPVTASVVDQQAALYGFGCRARGDVKITFGTGAFALMITGDEPVHTVDTGLLPTVAWQKQGQAPVFALDGGVYTASAALNWAKSLGLFMDFNDINEFSDPPAVNSGLVFVPALAGLGCPYWDPRARGLWTGLSLDHSPFQMVQSILEGVAFRAAEVLEVFDRCIPLAASIRVDGGMSKNPYFLQFLANAAQRNIWPSRMPELTGLGTIHLAADALGFEPETTPQFGEVSPQHAQVPPINKFKQAVLMSQDWSKGHCQTKLA